MKEKPILFSGPMVRAILEGRKTQTRRIIKTLPNNRVKVGKIQVHALDAPCPYGTVGDRLWVRENIYFHGANQNHYYSADKHGVGNEIHYRLMTETASGTCKASTRTIPSIFMPKYACRLFLEITDIRVERLQDITGPDVLAEGAISKCCNGHLCGCRGAYVLPEDGEPVDDPGAVFKELWDSINSKRAPWSDNPWVWVVEFKNENAPN